MIHQTSFLQSLGWALLHSLWQLALLWIIYQLITGINRSASSSFKSTLASLLLSAGFGWFLLTFVSSYYTAEETNLVISAYVPARANDQLNQVLVQVLPVASVVYLFLLLFPVKNYIRNYRYVKTIRRYGISKIDVEWRMFVQRIAGRMTIKKKVQVLVSEFVSSPVTVGFLKPVILVPLAALSQLSPQQMEAVLLHELSHIKRCDYLVNLWLNLIRVVLYFNPFVKALIEIVDREREKSCDEMVLQFQYDSYEYASALLSLERINRQNQVLTLGAVNSKDLLQRVELIMGVHERPAFRLQNPVKVLAGLFCIIAINALILSGRPAGKTSASLPEPLSAFLPVEAGEAASHTEHTGLVQHPASTGQRVRKEKAMAPAASGMTAVSMPLLTDGFSQASATSTAVPGLKKYQEEQVARALEASKKVLENAQWKEVEKSIADVFTAQEKETVKAGYEKALAKMDWKKWENNLKMAYDKMDWNRINYELSAAVNQVRLDSIQVVYNKAISKLENVKAALTGNDLRGIPDSEISLKEIEIKKSELQKALDELKNFRRKKVVHL